MSETEASAQVSAPIAEVKPVITESTDTTAEKPADESMNPRFAALIKKQKYIEAEKKRVKEQEVALAAREAKIKEIEEKAAAPKKKLNPIEALQEAGFTYQEATEYMLNNGEPTIESKVKDAESKIDKYIREQEEKEAKRLESEKELAAKAEAEAITKFKDSINSFLKENAETYELINLHDSQGDVFDLIDGYYLEHQKVLSTKEAADLIEAELEERVQKSVETKKFKTKLTPAPEVKKEDAQPTFSSKTLSHSASASTSTKPPAQSDKERLERALALLG